MEVIAPIKKLHGELPEMEPEITATLYTFPELYGSISSVNDSYGYSETAWTWGDSIIFGFNTIGFFSKGFGPSDAGSVPG